MFNVQPAKLDPAQVDVANDLERLWAKVIAEETERERERLTEEWLERSAPGPATDGDPAPRPQRNLLYGLLMGEPWSPWVSTPWDELLPYVLSQCVARTATADVKLLTFAMEKCKPANWSALYWLRAYKQAIAAKGELASERVLDEETGQQKEQAAERELRKREALKRELQKVWPTIERDLRDGAANGLSEAAKTGKWGMWDLQKAMEWAKQQGKLVSETPVSAVPNSVFNWGQR